MGGETFASTIDGWTNTDPLLPWFCEGFTDRSSDTTRGDVEPAGSPQPAATRMTAKLQICQRVNKYLRPFRNVQKLQTMQRLYRAMCISCVSSINRVALLHTARYERNSICCGRERIAQRAASATAARCTMRRVLISAAVANACNSPTTFVCCSMSVQKNQKCYCIPKRSLPEKPLNSANFTCWTWSADWYRIGNLRTMKKESRWYIASASPSLLSRPW